MKSGSLNLLEHTGPDQACTGIAFTVCGVHNNTKQTSIFVQNVFIGLLQLLEIRAIISQIIRFLFI
jgi:hypothetical protein